MLYLFVFYSEDMIDLLGKRPFANRHDDMDKWLDENRGEKSAPPPMEQAPAPADDAPTPAPLVASTRMDSNRR